jgi:hypothetical protein
MPPRIPVRRRPRPESAENITWEVDVPCLVALWKELVAVDPPEQSNPTMLILKTTRSLLPLVMVVIVVSAALHKPETTTVDDDWGFVFGFSGRGNGPMR